MSKRPEPRTDQRCSYYDGSRRDDFGRSWRCPNPATKHTWRKGRAGTKNTYRDDGGWEYWCDEHAPEGAEG